MDERHAVFVTDAVQVEFLQGRMDASLERCWKIPMSLQAYGLRPTPRIMSDKIVDQLARDWISAGVCEGDCLLVHSDLCRTLQRMKTAEQKATPSLVLRSFLEAVGKTGTLLLPLFNFGFAKGVPFDIRNSPSKMGALAEAGRLWPGAVRTGHPMYSFSAIGAKVDLFRDLTNFSGYGHESPFGVLHRVGGKIGVIDLPDQNSMTFYHYVEESQNVSYRYHKTFVGPYIDENGVQSLRKFGLFVRRIENGIVTHVEPMAELLWQKGIYHGFRPHEGCGLRLISAAAMFDHVAAVIRSGRARGLLYDFSS
jgi:aminoglycoside 3-N-acetyltransferase